MSSKTPIIRGRFKYKKDGDGKKSKKKNNRKIIEKAFKKEDKKLKKMCECNHLDSEKNKTHFKYIVEGEGADKVEYRVCKICNAKMLSDPRMYINDLPQAIMTIMSSAAIIRNKFPLTEKFYNDITNALYVVNRFPKFFEKLKNADIEDSKKKNKKGKKKKKNKNKKFERINY